MTAKLGTRTQTRGPLVLLMLLTAGCGAEDTIPRRAPSGSAHGTGTLWSVTQGVPYLRGIDRATGEVQVDVEVAQGATNIFSLVAGNGQVWLGRTDGVVLAVRAGAIQKQEMIGEDDVEALALCADSAYAATGSHVAPRLIRYDAADLSQQAEAPVLDVSARFESLACDGEHLFVLGGNDFRVHQLDRETLATLRTTPVGVDPSDPSTLGEFGGGGFMVEVAASLWVVDIDSGALISVNKETLAARVAGDVSDLLVPEGYMELVSNGTDFFFALSGQGVVVGFDGATGARKRTYAVTDGVGHVAASGEHLYVRTENAPEKILELDLASSELLRTFEDVPGDRIAVE
jgi:hypothetical protein